MFNQDISIINKKFNTTTKLDEYFVYHVKGFWSSKQGITISDTILSTKDQVIVRILMSEPNYVTPSVYQSATSVTNKWTLKNDDYIVKGLVTGPITKIASLKQNYAECMKITKVELKDYSSNDMKHFAIFGE